MLMLGPILEVQFRSSQVMRRLSEIMSYEPVAVVDSISARWKLLPGKMFRSPQILACAPEVHLSDE